MKIQDALKETGMAQHQSNLDWFVEVGVNGFLNWYDKYNPYIIKGRIKYVVIMSNDWKPYHPPACVCGKKGCVEEEEEVEPEGHPVICCEKKRSCGWPLLAVHYGLYWGPLPFDDLWKQRHSEKCGGKFIEAVI